MRRRILGAGCALLAALAGLGAGSAVAALLSGAASPIVSVGNAVIDATPGALKDWAVEKFGENDKLILIGSVTIVVLLIAAAIGVIGVTHRRLALLLAGLLGLVAVGAAAIDRTLLADWWVAVIPGLVTTLVVVVMFAWLLAAVDGRRTGESVGEHVGDAGGHRPPAAVAGRARDGSDRRRWGPGRTPELRPRGRRIADGCAHPKADESGATGAARRER
ncbi:hypothetical protein [Solicola gregarius]|uniref:Molybdopterin-binding oxidoreductase n=1 Tax=Solicola gregarius TaxID=2908642 RepID=A0AA46YKI2_9ACTN|nr:hypothetical protein [Solicola gregarius]UYM04604.1 hypothetical protein L0C25_19020 [Solicola gregarius]